MRIFLLFFVLFCIGLRLYGQKDFGLWSGLDLRLPLTEKLQTGVEFEMRFDKNVSQVNNSFISPYLKYDLHKHIGLGASYRYSNDPDGQGVFGTINLHRFTFDLEAKNLWNVVVKDSPFDAAIRLRYTHETTIADRHNDYWRTQLEIKYDWEKYKLKPEVSAELFYHFNDQLSYTFEEVKVHHRFNRLRVRMGMGYALSKRSELKLFYMVQSELESPRADYILGVSYSYRFKRIFKKGN